MDDKNNAAAEAGAKAERELMEKLRKERIREEDHKLTAAEQVFSALRQRGYSQGFSLKTDTMGTLTAFDKPPHAVIVQEDKGHHLCRMFLAVSGSITQMIAVIP